MRINDKDIVSMARELRDEENQQLHVRPWSRHRRFQFPAWLAAIPAAAIVGFLLGIWTNSPTLGEQPATALVDTVYVTVKETPSSSDTTLTESPKVSCPATRPVRPSASGPVRQSATNKPNREIPAGQPITSDRIRYDLLVKN